MAGRARSSGRFAPQNRLPIEISLILAMTMVGGLGTLTGPIIGAILLVVMWEIMRDARRGDDSRPQRAEVAAGSEFMSGAPPK